MFMKHIDDTYTDIYSSSKAKQNYNTYWLYVRGTAMSLP
jgi:hypothetical protein